MNKKNNLLIEIGTEELPADQLLNLSNSFIQNISKNIKNNKIYYKKLKLFYTPKRIAIILYEINNYSNKHKVIIKGPEKKLNNESDTIINLFLKNNNIQITNLKINTYKKKEYYTYEKLIPKKNILHLLPKIIQDSIYEIHIHKKMKWANIDKSFVRPIKWITIMLNKKNIFLEIFNIKSNNFSYGHSLLYNKKISINPTLYEKILEDYGKIIPCSIKRHIMITNSLIKIINNTNIFFKINETLINDNVNIVEYPTILVASYSKQLLKIPKELIINVIEKQQKCLIVNNKEKKITNKFILISNTFNCTENIIKNYQKVITARLKDITF
jgi:glycyl-tRNA synthetase beta chain